MKPENICKIADKPRDTFSSRHHPMGFIILFVFIRVIRRAIA